MIHDVAQNVYRSDDLGATWTQATGVPDTGNASPVTYALGLFWITGQSGDDFSAISIDGKHWHSAQLGGTDQVTGATRIVEDGGPGKASNRVLIVPNTASPTQVYATLRF